MSDMKSVLFAFIIVTIFTGSGSQFLQDMQFPQDLISFFFPKDPGIVKVRKIDQIQGMNMVLDFVGLVEQHGYPAEEHNVTTEDGYNLILHRVPGSPLWSNKGKKKVVFVQHGLMGSSDIWVLFGPGKDLVFLLADHGYDVWVGNIRGNTYCRSHVNMTTYDSKFWQFSFHEMGTQDLPVMIDYILNYTGEKDLQYIGHSMGTAILFVLLSTRPEYNEKIRMAICFSPVAFWPEITPSFRQIINFISMIKTFLNNNELYDFAPQSMMTITMATTFCSDRAVTQFICAAIIFLVAGPDPTQLNTTALPYLFSYYPAGSSVKTFSHFYQNMVANNFQQFDYGTINNYKRYKQKTPPSYDFKKITVPITLINGPNDAIILKQNYLEVKKHLPNVILAEEVPYKLFNHADFIWGINAKTLLYDRVIDILRKFEAGQDLATHNN